MERNKEAEGASLTSNSHHSFRFLASDEEDDVALRRVDIVVLEEKGLVDAVFLQRGELDKQVQWACKSFLKHEILLASYLSARVRWCRDLRR